MWVAPNSLAHSSLRVVQIDRDDRRRSGNPRTLDRSVAHSTATEHCDRVASADLAGVHGSAETRHDTAAKQTGNFGFGVGIHLGALAAGHERLLAERPDSERRRELGPVGEGHLLGGIVGVEAVLGFALQARAAVAAHRSPVENHVVTGRNVGYIGTHRLHDSGCLVAQQERKLVVDPALAVVEVGVADPAGLDLHDRLARSGIGNDDCFDGDRFALRSGNNSTYFLCHGGDGSSVRLVSSP